MPRALALLIVVVLALLAVWLGLAATGDEEAASTEAPPVASIVQDEAAVERTQRRRLGEGSTGNADADAEPSLVVEATQPTPRRPLRIETESGAPIPLIHVRWVVEGVAEGKGVTDADGRVVARDERTIGGVVPGIAAAVDATVELKLGRTTHELAPGADRLVLVDARPLEVRMVDSRNDQRLDAPQILGGERWVASHGPQAELELAPERLWLAEGIGGKLDFGDALGPRCGPLTERQLDGFVPTSRVAKSYRLTLPMRETLDVPVRWICDDEIEEPSVRVSYSAARVGSSVGRGDDGIAVSRPFPFFRGERVTASAWTDSHGGTITATVLTPGRQPELVVTLLPREPHGDIGVGGGSGGAFGSRGSGLVVTRPRGNLVIQAFHRDGTVAAGVEVRPGGRTDENGVVRVDGLLPGSRLIGFREPGVVPSWTKVEVPSGSTTHVTLHEREGRTVTIFSRDDEGVPLRYARVDLRQPSYVDYVSIDDQGVADLALWTDSQGRLTLRHLEEGDLEFTVRYGSRRVEVSAALDQPQVEAVFTPVE